MLFSGGLVVGVALAHWREILRFFRPAPQWNGPAPPPSRILKPFTSSAKRKPRVNNDEKAWLAENSR